MFLQYVLFFLVSFFGFVVIFLGFLKLFHFFYTYLSILDDIDKLGGWKV